MIDPTGLSERVGLKPYWVYLRCFWDGQRYNEVHWSDDGTTWNTGPHRANVLSIRYVGGPRDGQVEI